MKLHPDLKIPSFSLLISSEFFIGEKDLNFLQPKDTSLFKSYGSERVISE